MIPKPFLPTAATGSWRAINRCRRVVPPRAAYNLAMPMAAGFLAANAITGDYQEPFNIGQGPINADPEIAYGMAFAVAYFTFAAITFRRRAL